MSRAEPFLGNPPSWRGWTPEATAELVRRAAAGESAGQIAIALGCSRNTVIGKARRTPGVALGQSSGGRRQTIRAARTAKVRAQNVSEHQATDSKAAAPKAIAAPKAAGAEPGLPAARLPVPPDAAPTAHRLLARWQCPWPLDLSIDGDGGADMTCCGAPRADERAYCATHERAAWRGGGSIDARGLARYIAFREGPVKKRAA